MRFAHILMRNFAFRKIIRYYSVRAQFPPIVRVVCLNDDDAIKFTFKLYNSPYLNIKAPQNEIVNILLSRIKLMASLQLKREEMKKEIIKKYSNTDYVAVETVEEYIDVCLIGDNKLIDEETLNIDAWPQASILKIGDITYEVQYNTPVVLNMTLPDCILCGCFLRPHFILECADVKDSVFTWYRSQHSDGDIEWLKAGKGFNYLTSPEDVGCYLKLVCSPRKGEKVGPDFSTFSQNVVEDAPHVFPFEERHAYTKTVCNSDRFRCVSYNILANMYVEKRKFPYASIKARDVYYRKQLLLKELLGYNSDIICLQEVQERVFEYDIAPILETAGFCGYFTRKGGRRYEGLATFYRLSKFRVVFNQSILLNEVIKDKNIFVDLLTKVSGNYKDMSKMLAQDTAFQTVLLEVAENPSKKILIANTHLYSNKDTPEVRLIQAALCIYYLEHIIKSKSVDSIGILFCGDFNSLPHSEAYNFITSGNYQCCPTWKNNNINADSNEDNTLRHTLHLESACGTPEYTNYTKDFQGCLDYIFYSNNFLEVTDIVPMPSHESVTEQVGLPSEYFSSDHLALVCTLKWKTTES